MEDLEKVNRWYYNDLSEPEKQDIIDVIYPGELMTDLDEAWRWLPLNLKLEAYEENKRYDDNNPDSEWR